MSSNMSNPLCSDATMQMNEDGFINHQWSESSNWDIEGNTDNGMEYLGYSMGVQELTQKRREIEERTVNSSNRTLGLLYESEHTGVATAVELNRQKEQLKRTEERLDAINSTLKTSERHLKGIKSLFGGIKNYVRSRNTDASGRGNSSHVILSNTSASAPWYAT